ncbi:hypothetical protein [Streptomyces sp. NPDC056661]|uniref:hypothetical protein n=1 Tax=Streptomyces sp. NPDC056661 TaxID=3345898 RepID=UPI00367C25BF
MPAAGAQRTPTPEEVEAIEEVMREHGEKFSKAAQEPMLDTEKDSLPKLLPAERGVLGVFDITDVNGLPITLAASDPVFTNTGLRAGVTTLDQLQHRGPFGPVFTPVLGANEPTDAWLRPLSIAA